MTNTFKTIKAFKDYFLIKAKREGSEVSVKEAHQLIQKKEPLALLDVREKEEIALGYIEGAVFIPQGLLGGSRGRRSAIPWVTRSRTPK